MNGHNLTVYDFVVDLIPGVLAILIVVSLLPAETIGGLDLAEMTVGSSALIVVLGYFVGHLVQAVASPIDKKVYIWRQDHYPFEQALAEARDDSVEERFDENIERFFSLDSDGSDGLNDYEVFKLTQSYLWNNDIGRAQRFQVLYTFLRSVWVLSVAGAVLHLLGLVASECTGYQLVWSPLQSTVIIGVLVVAAGIAYLRRVKYHKMMADALIFDFYANVLGQEDDREAAT
ncbi:hypothetical protein PNP85_02715 [Halobacterium salinarum]|uniref:hypothetical protein n=1 Tax=Halobacterium salinarum TaxID=2242 RepID=UPI002555BA41|nr:hypothetical protein [Halobacterium salinarum]MDL0135672.1 hypothetical protein [Halobacterium salinarum]MDL0138423.1 hypothetical protein [Halobacterium salinarum]